MTLHHVQIRRIQTDTERLEKEIRKLQAETVEKELSIESTKFTKGVKIATIIATIIVAFIGAFAAVAKPYFEYKFKRYEMCLKDKNLPWCKNP